MTAGVVPVLPKFRFTDGTGVPLAGGSLTVYMAGTTTLASTYLDSALATPGPNPIPLDANGECTVWASPANTYKWLLKNSSGATVPGWPIDNIACSSNASDVAAAALVVAGISAAVTTVSGIAANVTTVAGVAANVTTVAGVAANVTTVAGVAANVTSVASDLSNINSVAGGLTNINSVASDLSNINSVASDLSNINSVAGSIANVNTVGANISIIAQALAANSIFASTADALSKGVAGITSLVGGSGGTNGTFDLAFSGGAGSGAVGRFTVAGGVVVSTILTYPGRGYTSAPTVSFAASSGLTGASATAQIANNVDPGEYFLVPSTVTGESFIVYLNNAGSAQEVVRLGSATTMAVNTESPITALYDVNAKGVEHVDKSANHYLAGMTDSVQKIVTDLQTQGLTFQKRDSFLAQTTRDADLVTSTIFDFTGQSEGTLAFAPGIVRTGKTTAFAVCERRNFNGAGSGDQSIKHVVGCLLTYSRSARTVTAGSVVDVAANVPYSVSQVDVGAITAGSGGTPGTYTLAWVAATGNLDNNPVGTFTIGAGGTLTAVTITSPGLRAAGAGAVAPTPDFSASGVTGAAVVLTAHTSLGPYNPCLTYVKTGTHAGRILCHYSILGPRNVSNSYDYVLPRLRYSDDSGATWSAEIDLTATLVAATSVTVPAFNIGPGHGIQLSDGRLVVPGNLTISASSCKSYLLVSSDGGDTWSVSSIVTTANPNECAIADMKNGELLWLLRSINYTGLIAARLEFSTLKVLDYVPWLNSSGAAMLGQVLAIFTSLHQCEADWDASVRKLVMTRPSEPTGLRKDCRLYVSYDYGASIAGSVDVNPGRFTDYSDVTNFGPNDIAVLYSDGAASSSNIVKLALVSCSAFL